MSQKQNLSSDGQTSDSAKQTEQSSEAESETISKYDNASQSSDDKRKPAVSKVNRSASPSQTEQGTSKSPCRSSENDCVSSTNKEDEETSIQPTQSQSADDQRDSDFGFASDEKSESTAYEESEDVSYSQSEQTDSKSESTFASQDVSEENNVLNELTSDDYDPDEADNVRERRNPKTCVERETPQQFDDNTRPKNFSQNFQRNRHMRPQMPRPNHPYGGGPGGPDFNPQFMQQFRGARRPPMMPGPQPEFMRGHNMNMMRGPPNLMQRMPPGMPPHPSRMPGGPGHMGPMHQRMQRPPFQTPPTMFGNNPGMPPQGNYYRYSSE